MCSFERGCTASGWRGSEQATGFLESHGPGMRDSGARRGVFSHRDRCRLCESRNLVRFLEFGDVPLAGAFLRPEEIAAERFYPLGIDFCETCTLVQVSDVIPKEVLFKNYFYFSSAIRTLVEHFETFAGEMAERFALGLGSLVVELGCNDGVFLRPLHALGMRCVGVDPATNVVNTIRDPGITVLNDFFSAAVAEHVRAAYGLADAVVSSFSFAHIDDMVDVMQGIKTLLKPAGVFVFEVYYLGIVLEELQYDMMYHEHMSYYSLASLVRFLERFGMEIFEVRRLPLRAGTIRYYARNIGGRKEPVSPSVTELREYERARGFDTVKTYLTYADRVAKTRTDLMELLGRLKQEGRRIIGYGASGRATTIMAFCGIGASHLDFVVDDAPAKHGFYTPGSHLAIRPWAAAEEARPDYALLFAWSFADEVKRRRIDYLRLGGQFIVPLPEVRVMSA
jgi:methylation protein EvaC